MPLRLETQRLILRSFTERDAAPFAAYRSDPQVARYQGWNTPFTLEQAFTFIHKLKTTTPGEPGKWYQIAIELKSGGKLIGDCAFHRLPEDHQQAEIAFTLARDFQGQGYASEAVACLLDYLFSNLNLHRVRANSDPDNLPSKRLMERLGMRHEGSFVESLWLKNAWVNEDWYAILRREWEARGRGS